MLFSRFSSPPLSRLRRAVHFQIEGLEKRVLLSTAIAAFGAQQTFATGSNPRSVAIADANSDGKLDLLIANSGSNTAGVLLGNGNGTYQLQQTYAVGTTPFSIAAADVNLDGKLDLITANNGGNSVSVLLGNGNGSFHAQTTFAAGTNSRFIAVADINGDGKPDLITANYGTTTVSVLLGNGSGTFANQQTFSAGTKPFSIAVADFNMDGKLDLAVANKGSNNVSILLGNGNGTFQTQQFFTVGSAPFSIATGDLNQDGKLDLVTADESSNAVSVLLGNGNGTFQTHQTYATGTIPCAVALSDTNGDGKLDVVAANYSVNSVSVLLGNGNGTLQPQKTFATGTNPFGLAVADVNRDGRQDLLVANEGSGSAGNLLGDVPPTVLSINRTTPAGPNTVDSSVTYTVTFSEPVTGVDPTDFALALTGTVTTAPPLVVNGSAAVYTVTVNGVSGSGTLGLNLVDDGSIKDAAGNPPQPGGMPAFSPQQTTLTGQGGPIAVADLNGDGKPDVILAGASTGNYYNSYAVSVLLGNGNGTFQAGQTFAGEGGLGSITVADVNADGKADLVTAKAGILSVLLGNGNGTFQPQQTLAFGAGFSSLAVADVNGDGRLDLVVTNVGRFGNNSNVGVLLGNGDGTFQAQQTFATGFAPDWVTVADVNDDGKPDLVVSDSGYVPDPGTTLSVLLGNGNGTFQNQMTLLSGGQIPQSAVVADVNGDGKPDIVVSNYDGNGDVGVLLGNGNGTFRGPQTFATTSNPYSVLASDVNGDGALDLVVGNPKTGSLGVFPGNGDGTFRPQQTFSTSREPWRGGNVIAVNDLNTDGRLDIVSSTGYVLLGNSNGNFTGQVFTISPPADTITGTSNSDSIALTKDTDGTDIDWAMGASNGVLPINDPHGLTINGNGGTDTISVNGGAWPNVLHLNGTFTINGLSATNLLANTNLEIGRSTVYISYSSSDPLSLIQGYLKNGYNNGAWNGTPTASTGVITSIPAASNAAQTTAIGYADSADGLIAGQPANTIELKYTLYGDTSLAGTVGFNDFTRLTQHYNQTTGGTWDTGDFNYNGSVNFGDFTLMTRTYNTTLGSEALPAVTVAQAAAPTDPSPPVWPKHHRKRRR